MYSRVPPSHSGAWVSSCLCAPSRAFRFARPCLGRQPSRISPISRLVRRLAVQVSTAPQGHFLGPSGLTAHHEQQEGKRSNCSLVLASQFSQADRRTIVSTKVGSFCLLWIRRVKQNPPRPCSQKLGFLGAEPLSALLPTFPAWEK